MNDIHWLTDSNPYGQLYLLDGGVSDRRMRLAGIAACRLCDAVMEHAVCREGLDIAERYADELGNREEMEMANRACIAARAQIGERVAVALSAPVSPYPIGSSLPPAMEAIRRLDGANLRPNGVMPASKAHRAIFYDIFGKLFRTTVFQSQWRTSTVQNLAQTIYDNRTFSDLPILADALEDAGCDWADIFDHLRGPGPHVRGCWAIDQCLGFDELTETEWLAATDPWPMYLYVHPLMSERKIRLLGCGYCRRIWDLAEEFFQKILLAVERHVEGEPPAEEEFVYLNNDDIFGGDGPVTFAFGNLSCVERPAVHTTGSILHDTAAARGEEAFMFALGEVGDPGPETDAATEEARRAEKVEQAQLLRCIVGNPFRSVAIHETWKTKEAVALAQDMYDHRDFMRMPELAKIFVAAGCDDETVLEHCHSNGPHARGCWVIDLILSKDR